MAPLQGPPKAEYYCHTKEHLSKLIQQEALIVKEPSSEGTAELSLPTNSYFGIGLCSSATLSRGLPIDVLEMILLSERIARQKSILIADSHAKTNFSDPTAHVEIDKLAKQYRGVLQTVLDNLGFKGWTIVLASEIDQSDEYQQLVRSTQESNPYIAHELADIESFRTQYDVRLKIGWALQSSRDYSETMFDRKYRAWSSQAMSFLYSVPGRTFDPTRPRSSPYFCDDPTKRIMLDPSEDVKAKLSLARCSMERVTEEQRRRFEDAFNGYLKFLGSIVRLYGRLVRPLTGSIEERIEQLLKQSVG